MRCHCDRENCGFSPDDVFCKEQGCKITLALSLTQGKITKTLYPIEINAIVRRKNRKIFGNTIKNGWILLLTDKIFRGFADKFDNEAEIAFPEIETNGASGLVYVHGPSNHNGWGIPAFAINERNLPHNAIEIGDKDMCIIDKIVFGLKFQGLKYYFAM